MTFTNKNLNNKIWNSLNELSDEQKKKYNEILNETFNFCVWKMSRLHLDYYFEMTSLKIMI